MTLHLLLITVVMAANPLDSLRGFQLAPADDWDAGESPAHLLDPLNADEDASTEVVANLPGVGILEATRIAGGTRFVRLRSLPESGVRVSGRITTIARIGSKPPANALGQAYSATERLKIESKYFQVGAIADRDRYEPNWDDLLRCWVSADYSNYRVIAGDFNAEAGFGSILHYGGSFFSSTGSAGEAVTKRPRIRPSGSTEVNSALRGVGVAIAGGSLTGFAAFGLTHLDATLDAEGIPINLTGEGLHRTEGESRKRNSVTESFGGTALQYDALSGPVNFSLGAAVWGAAYDPGFWSFKTPVVGGAIQGVAANAGGIWMSVESADLYGGAEVSSDRDGSNAVIVRLGRVDPDAGCAIRAVTYNYDPQYVNPHAKGFRGQSPANLVGAGISVEYEVQSATLEKITGWLDYHSDVVKVSASEPLASAADLRCSGWFKPFNLYDGELRVGRHQRWENRTNIANATANRIRLVLSEKQGKMARYWIEAASTEGSRSKTSMAVSALVRWQSRIPELLSYSCTPEAELYSCGSELPIYTSEVNSADLTSPVRLSGRGLRVAAEIELSSFDKADSHVGTWHLSVCGARRLPFGGGSSATMLYLSFGWW